MQWFRSAHGAPTDPKWQMIARRAGVRPGDVAAVWWTILDHASQQEDRGNVAGLDPEEIAAALGYPDEDVARVIEALSAKGLIADGRLARWERHQPQRERAGSDDSRDRVRRHRAAKHDVTPCNASATPCNAEPGHVTPPEQSRAEQNRGDQNRGGESGAEDDPGPVKDPGRPAKARRKTRLTLTALPDDWRTWAAAERPDLDPASVWKTFSDHWRGRGEPMADWEATWRNWVRRERAPPGRSPPAASGAGNLLVEQILAKRNGGAAP